MARMRRVNKGEKLDPNLKIVTERIDKGLSRDDFGKYCPLSLEDEVLRRL
jgi:hypothetical protein